MKDGKNFKTKIVTRILLILAQYFCEDEKIREEIRNLSTHISVWMNEDDK